MTWKTHMIGGLQAGVVFAALTGAEPNTAALEIGAAAIGSILPDLDHHNSKISRSDLLLGAVSRGLSKVTVHRREVHTIWASFLFALISSIIFILSSLTSSSGISFAIGLAIAVGIDLAGGKIGSLVGLSYFLFGPEVVDAKGLVINPEAVLPCTVAIFIGCLAHLVYDSANVQGIMWLHPFSRKRYRFLNITTSSKEETIFALVMLIVLMFLTVASDPLSSQDLQNIMKEFNYF